MWMNSYIYIRNQSVSVIINEKAIPKVTKFVFGVFQGKVLSLNIILYVSISQEKQKL